MLSTGALGRWCTIFLLALSGCSPSSAPAPSDGGHDTWSQDDVRAFIDRCAVDEGFCGCWQRQLENAGLTPDDWLASENELIVNEGIRACGGR